MNDIKPTSNEPENLDPTHITRYQFERAIVHLEHFKSGLIDFLETPKRSIELCFPIETDDGSVKTYCGYRVLHNRALGSGKGGIRYYFTSKQEREETGHWWKYEYLGLSPFLPQEHPKEDIYFGIKQVVQKLESTLSVLYTHHV